MTKKGDKQRIKKAESNLETVEGVLTRSEMWFERNSKKLTIGVIVVVVVVLGIFGYYRFIQAPKVQRAQSEMFMAERYFGQSEYQKALDGDGNHAGFLEIINNYGSTKPGKLAAYYAGICYLNLGQFEEAITYLKKYNISDEFFCVMAEGAIGDANLELGRVSEAIAHYKKAASMRVNAATTPVFMLKSAMCNEMDNHLQAALDEYEKIRKDYPDSNEGRDAEKYIARVKAKMTN